MNLSKIPWLAVLAMILVTTGCSRSSTHATVARRQIPEPPANLIPNESVQPANQPIQQLSNTILAWDTDHKEVTVPKGTPEAHFTFTFTNISSQIVTILSVSSSCGCTVAKLPERTKIKPGDSGKIDVTMNLKDKMGTLTKTVAVGTDKGMKLLQVTTNLPIPPRSQKNQ